MNCLTTIQYKKSLYLLYRLTTITTKSKATSMIFHTLRCCRTLLPASQDEWVVLQKCVRTAPPHSCIRCDTICSRCNTPCNHNCLKYLWSGSLFALSIHPSIQPCKQPTNQPTDQPVSQRFIHSTTPPTLYAGNTTTAWIGD